MISDINDSEALSGVNVFSVILNICIENHIVMIFVDIRKPVFLLLIN